MPRLKYKTIFTALISLVILITPGLALAAIPINCPDGYETTVVRADQTQEKCANHQTGTSQDDSVEARQVAADPSRGADLNADCDDKGNCCESDNLTKDNCTIVGYIVTLVNILSGLVGLVVVIMIAYGGIRYSASRDNPQETAAAKAIIRNAIIALITYIFSFAFLQYIIPGGLF